MANDNDRSSLSGLTEAEAQEFHGLFVTSFIGFIADRDLRAHPGLDLAAVDSRAQGLCAAGRRARRVASALLSLVELRRTITCIRYGCCSIRAALWSRLSAFLFVLALLIHFILLSTDRFNWLEGKPSRRARSSRRSRALASPDPGEAT